jgi:DNA-directed RNA polymerase alpha subunit
MLHDVDQSHLHLEVRGEGVVTAADIQVPAEVEIVTPTCTCLLSTTAGRALKLT